MKKKLFTLCAVCIALILLVSACAPATTQAVTEATAVPETQAANIEAATPATTPISVGGTVTMAFPFDPDSLDIQKANTGAYVGAFIYSSLIAKDPDGNYVPYMAESWEISPDGLAYTFHLKHDVKFHNGDPVTAQDWVWSFERAVNPDTASPLSGVVLGRMKSVEAVDDYTLKLTLTEPYYYLFDNLQYEGIMGVLSKRAVEESGDDYARSPVGAGPFIFKEWVTADHITLERNPDFTWGPSYTNGTPPNIQTLIFRTIPESSTIVAGLEAGEITWAGNGYLAPVDVNSLESTGMFDVIRFPAYATMPYINLNLSKEPFNDLRVRQALNLAVDRQAMIDIVVPDSGATPAYGPLPPSAEGYWSGVEQIGYTYDLERAKQLMQDAGYTYNSNGMLEKDGVPLSFTLYVINGLAIDGKADEVLQSQWKQLGVDVNLEISDIGVLIQKLISGDYGASDMGWGAANSELLDTIFNSKFIGANNFSFLNDPEMDAILAKMVSSTSLEDHLNWSMEAQKRTVEQAYIIPLFNQMTSEVINKQLQGYAYIKSDMGFRLWDAYLQP